MTFLHFSLDARLGFAEMRNFYAVIMDQAAAAEWVVTP